jgi:hypothetical protein
MTNRDESQWRAAYTAMQARRAASAPEPTITLDAIAALARSGADTPARVELLHRVVADPVARDEYRILRDVATAPEARRRRPAWLAIAAALVVAAGVSTWRSTPPPGATSPVVPTPTQPATSGPAPEAAPPTALPAPDPLRGDEVGPVPVAPVPAEVAASGVRFVWRAVAGTREYALEIVTEDGDRVLSRRTADTTLVWDGPLPSLPGPWRWWVEAHQAGGVVLRSPMRVMRTR